MKFSVRYLILAALVLGTFTALFFTIPAPLIYSLGQDSFYSRYHDNTDVLKVQQLNSTTDLQPLMQDLMDFTGPIALNINLKDMDQVRQDLEIFKKYHRNLDNLVVKLDMSESEINEFSKSSERQRALLTELMNASISLDELQQLEIQYRADNNPNMLISVNLQQEAIRQRLKEIDAQYKTETEKIQTISKKYTLDTSSEEQSISQISQIVEKNTQTAPEIESQALQGPALSLIIKPGTGKYLDAIDVSAFYSSGSSRKTSHPITIFVDNTPIIQAITDTGGAYHGSFAIEKIRAGMHEMNATIENTASEPRNLNVVLVPSSTSIFIKPVSNKPEVVVSGTVVANKPVRFAPVDIRGDSRMDIYVITDSNGLYQTQIRFSPGTHWIDARFDNTSYPILSSISPAYEIVASQDKIMSVKLMNVTTNADTLRLTITPTNATYNETIYFSGELSGKNPKYRNVDIFIDRVYHQSALTGLDGSYITSYTIEKIRRGTHTVFAHYLEPGTREIYSALSSFRVNPVNSVTTLEIDRTDNGTRITCRGNVTAQAIHIQQVSSAPLELVWDDRYILDVQTDDYGSFMQKVILPEGNHSIYARFISPDYPVNSSWSRTYPVTITPAAPGLSLESTPISGIFHDILTFSGVVVSADNRKDPVDIYVDNKFLISTPVASSGSFVQTMEIERLPAGQHSVEARLHTMSSGARTFYILPAHSLTTLTVTPVNNSALYTCNGTVMAFNRSGDVIRKPAGIKDVLEILPALGKNPYDAATRPVNAAPVLLTVNNKTFFEMQTDDLGRFSCVVAFPSGDNVILARFVNKSFPLFASQTKEITVNIPSANMSPLVTTWSSSGNLLVPAISVAAILILFAGGSIFYLKRRSIFIRPRRIPADLNSEPDVPDSIDLLTQEMEAEEISRASEKPQVPDIGSTDPILARYIRILNAQGLSTAARAVYVHFAGTIAERLHIHRHRTLTPREFLRSCERRSFTGKFSIFIAVYEQVRYAGATSPAKENEFEESVKQTDESLGGEKD